MNYPIEFFYGPACGEVAETSRPQPYHKWVHRDGECVELHEYRLIQGIGKFRAYHTGRLEVSYER